MSNLCPRRSNRYYYRATSVKAARPKTEDNFWGTQKKTYSSMAVSMVFSEGDIYIVPNHFVN